MDLDENRGFYGPAGMLKLRYNPPANSEPFVPAEVESKRYSSYLHDKTVGVASRRLVELSC